MISAVLSLLARDFLGQVADRCSLFPLGRLREHAATVANLCPAETWAETLDAYRETLDTLTAAQLDTTGPEACELIEGLLVSAGYPDLAPTERPPLPCLPPPPPSSPTVRSPQLGDRLEGVQHLAAAREALLAAAPLLGPAASEVIEGLLTEIDLLGCREQFEIVTESSGAEVWS